MDYCEYAKGIKFYRVTDDFGEFSNFAMFAIEIDGCVWPSSEHYFQAQKFEDSEYREVIRNANTAMDAAILGRDRKRVLTGC